MKILWLHQFFATPAGWGATRTYEFGRRFVAMGHAVDVVCADGYDKTLPVRGRIPVEIAGMRIFAGSAGCKKQTGFLGRLLSFTLFMLRALWFVLRHGRRYDLIIVSSGPLSLAIPALVCRWLWGAPYVFEVIDVWPASAIAAGVLRNPVLKWLSFRLEKLAYNWAALAVTCSTGMTARVVGGIAPELNACPAQSLSPDTPDNDLRGLRGVETIAYREGVRGGRLPVVTIPNCCDLDTFSRDEEQRRRTRARLGVRADQMVAFYSGAMGVSNGLDDLLKAVQELAHDKRIHWWFAGGGACEHLIKQAVEAAGGEQEGRARFFGCLSKESVAELCMAADINLVTFRHEPLFGENSPNKFFDGIAAGVPALFNRTTWLEPWLEEYDCGVACSGGEVAWLEMAAALCALAGDPARRARMGAGARRLAREVFDRDAMAQRYERWLLLSHTCASVE